MESKMYRNSSNARSGKKTTEEFYKSIINKVMSNTKGMFADNGISERVYDKLKSTWLKKLEESDAYGNNQAHHNTLYKRITKLNHDNDISNVRVDGYNVKNMVDQFRKGNIKSEPEELRNIKSESIMNSGHTIHKPLPQKPIMDPSFQQYIRNFQGGPPSINNVAQSLNLTVKNDALILDKKGPLHSSSTKVIGK